MLTVDDYGRIWRAHRDEHSRDGSDFSSFAAQNPKDSARRTGGACEVRSARKSVCSKLEQFHDRILEILKLDEAAPPKQRHTAMRIFERLRDEHDYVGGYDAVRRFVKKHRESKRETFIPLDHAAGQRVEADFGEISVDFPDGRRKVNVLILVWSYSNAPFAIALPTQRTEAILEGMSQAFEFFGCVPKEVWWDNPKTVATAILEGREHTINERYAALASHFAFDPLYCMPPGSEGLGSNLRRPKIGGRKVLWALSLYHRWRIESAHLISMVLHEFSWFAIGSVPFLCHRFKSEGMHPTIRICRL